MLAIKPLFQSLHNKVNDFFEKNNLHSRLEVVHLDQKYVVICCRFFLKTYVRLKLRDIILDSALLSQLPPAQAAWIGYYYGVFCSGRTHSSEESGLEFSGFQDEKFPFQLYGLDRKGYLVYFNKNSTETVLESPFKILKDLRLIEKFHPSQACYIGLLAGRVVLKNNMRKAPLNKNKPALQSVK